MKTTKTILKGFNQSCFNLAFSSFISFSLRLLPSTSNYNYNYIVKTLLNLFGSFEGFSIERLFLFVGLYCLFSHIRTVVDSKEIYSFSSITLSLLFAFFMVFGEAFALEDTWRFAMSWENGQVLKSCIVFSGYFVLFVHVNSYLFYKLDSINLNKRNDRLIRMKNWRLFLSILLTLLIAYIPYIYVSYPAILMGDSTPQIVQAFEELRMPMNYMTEETLLSNAVFINQHHPVMHTLLIHFCLLLGSAFFGSFNSGIFIYACLQLFVFISSVAYGITILVNNFSFSVKLAVFAILYFVLHPMVRNYAFLVSKDVFYASFLIVLVVNVCLVVSGQKGKLSNPIILVSSILLILFRNDAKYVLTLSFVIIALLCKKQDRKQFTLHFLTISIITAIIFNVIFPALYFTPGSRREMLSVPFQQTARYVYYHEDEVTREERETINKVLDYDHLAQKYNPSQSDNVKATFKEKCTNEDLIAYFGTWWKMFLKHPGTYIQATMNNYYQYFYPGNARFSIYTYSWSEQMMGRANEAIKPLGESFSYPKKTEALRELANTFTYKLCQMPGFSLLMTPAVYSWAILFIAFYLFAKPKKQNTSIIVIPIVILIVCILGPCNGSYGRYSYPFVIIMPFLFGTLRFVSRREADN